ncbi:hypothetical protein ILUMI_07272 [Ignelater luminosus]|uniref:Uncharacterized protein n=1 Tax=Ignelater luminosus TaxID=2038154 RepID=A0A8K0GI77_IGNLU|nr:hypothetical protein ILUMI_07272 [Ignelater luminosus]
MEEMIDMMKEEAKKIRKDQAEFLKDMGRITIENKELKLRIEHSENKIEKIDREKRKMNIIIPENAEAEKIGVKTKLNKIQHVGARKEG